MAATAAQRLDKMMAEYEPAIAAQARAALATLRKRVKGAVEMVYDNYNALVIGFVPTERPSDVVLSIALYPRWVTMFFMHGARLPDPAGRLEGDGKQVRGIRLASAKTLDEPAVRALITAACDQARVAFDPKQPPKLVIQAVSPKRRPRRAPATAAARPRGRAARPARGTRAAR
jgi:hypothetical protein